MQKRLLFLITICGLLFATTACGNYNIADESAPPQTTEENPFTKSEEDASLGALSHEEAAPVKADDQSVLPYEYNGGEFILDYQFTSEGKLDSIGFLLFLDGKPQAYKVNDTKAEYEYLHCFQTSEKHKEKFSFIFTPNTGKKGDILNITVISITKPDFKPDMKETSSYGWYHQYLERTLKLHFNEDAPDSDGIYVENENIFRNVSVTEKKVTSSFVENELVKNGWNDVTIDTLDNGVYPTISYDGELVYDNINLTNKDTLKIRYTICGTAGARYGISFFLNHKPISFDKVISYDTALSKGNVWIIEATIDTSKLDGFNTFYAVAVAASNDGFANKTGSILLYKEGKTQKSGANKNTAKVGTVNGSAFSGKVHDCYYADGNRIIVAADKLYLYDTQKGKNIASAAIPLEELCVQAYSDGYFIVGVENSSGNDNGNGSFATSQNGNNVKGYLLSKDFDIKNTISFNGLLSKDFILETASATISQDGKQIAFSGLQGLYLYDISSKKVRTILNYSENGRANNIQIMGIDSLTFTGEKTLTYVGTGVSSNGGDGISVYGTVSTDNASVSITKKPDYEVEEVKKGGDLLIMPQSFNKNNGTLLMLNTASNTEKIMAFSSSSEGKDGVFCSGQGRYVATSILGKASITIRIYDTTSGKVIHIKTIKNNNNAYFWRVPQILMLDKSGTCIVVLGRGMNKVNTLITTYKFKG